MATQHQLYMPLNASDHQIRVIDLLPNVKFGSPIECSLRIVSLDEDPDYDGLSWCWGLGHRSGTLLVNGQTFECSSNLEASLRHFRDTTVLRTLWVDAICINQADLTEKGGQIPLMGRVYSQAQVVRAWLGEATIDSDEAVEIMKQFQRFRGFRNVKINGRPMTVPQTRSFIALLQRPWWTRTWIVQEVLLARKAVLYCGSAWFDFKDLHLIFMDAMAEKGARVMAIISGELTLVLDDTAQELEDALFLTLREALQPFAQVTHIVESSRNGRRRNPIDTLKAMLALGPLKATDLRDKIYGCMGIFPELTKLIPVVDYEISVVKLYAYATYSLMSFYLGTLHPICYFQASTMSGLPSWSLRFDRDAECTVEIPRKFHAFANKGWEEWTPPEIQISHNLDTIGLSVSGSCLDEIVSCHPTLPDWMLYYEAFNDAKQRHGHWHDSASHLLFPHYFLCHRRWRVFFGLDADRSSHAAYVGGDSIEEAYWRTAAFGLSCTKSKALKTLGKNDIKTYLQFLQHEAQHGCHKPLEEGRSVCETQGLALAQDYDLGVLHATGRDYGALIRNETPYGTTLFKTSRGYFGLALHEVSPGDHVYILDRATLPIILRAQRDDAEEIVFRVMSACYTHGVMNGQAFDPLPEPASRQSRRHELRKKIFGGQALHEALPLKKWDRITLI